jgi:hypothetical protein
MHKSHVTEGNKRIKKQLLDAPTMSITAFINFAD